MPVIWGLVLAGWVLVLGGALFWRMAWSVPRWKELSALFGLPKGVKPPVRMVPASGYVNELLYRGCLTVGWDGRTLYLLPMGGRWLGMRVVGIPAERLLPGRRRGVAEDLSNWQFTWGLQWFRISGTDLKVALGKDWAKQVANAQAMMETGGERWREGALADEAGDEDAGIEEVVAGGDDFGLGAGEGDSLKVAAVCG